MGSWQHILVMSSHNPGIRQTTICQVPRSLGYPLEAPTATEYYDSCTAREAGYVASSAYVADVEPHMMVRLWRLPWLGPQSSAEVDGELGMHNLIERLGGSWLQMETQGTDSN